MCTETCTHRGLYYSLCKQQSWLWLLWACNFHNLLELSGHFFIFSSCESQTRLAFSGNQFPARINKLFWLWLHAIHNFFNLFQYTLVNVIPSVSSDPLSWLHSFIYGWTTQTVSCCSTQSDWSMVTFHFPHDSNLKTTELSIVLCCTRVAVHQLCRNLSMA